MLFASSFFFNDTATTEIYTLSLHDALPISMRTGALPSRGSGVTVLLTNASSERAISGAVSASRQPLALRRRIAFDGSRSEGRVDEHLYGDANGVSCDKLCGEREDNTGPSTHRRLSFPSISTTHP